jgi:hypothetical protein
MDVDVDTGMMLEMKSCAIRLSWRVFGLIRENIITELFSE